MSEQIIFERAVGKENPYPKWHQAEVWVRGNEIIIGVASESFDAQVSLSPEEVKLFAAYLLEAVALLEVVRDE